MKIAILARILNQNSGARAPIKLAQYLAGAGNEVDFYSFDLLFDPEVKKKLERQQIKVNIIHISKTRVIGNFIAGIRLFFSMRGKKYELVSSHTPAVFVIAAKLSGAFIVRTDYGTQLSQLTISKKAGLEVHPTLTEMMLSWFWDRVVQIDVKAGFTFSDYNVTISKYLQKEMKELYDHNINYIYLGAETENFNHNSVQQVPNTNSKTVSLLSVSRIVAYKGFDLIIKAFNVVSEKYPQAELTIIGSVADQGYLNTLNKLKNNKVKIIHNPSDSELLNYYRQCQIYVSGDLWAPWSLTPLEASFFAKPLLGLNRGAMNEIINDGKNGLLASDLADLTDKMEQLVKDQKLREKLGAEARKIAITKFTWEKTAREYLDLFKKLIKEKN